MREEEFYFLGLATKPNVAWEESTTAKKFKEIQNLRKKKQEDVYKESQESVNKIKDLIIENEQYDMRDRMNDERMLWIIDYKKHHEGKLPKDVAEFYKRADVEKPKTEEQLAAEEEARKAEMKSKKTKKKKKKPGKKKGGKKEVKKQYLWTGPTTDAVMKLEEQTDKYRNAWECKDEDEMAFNK